MKQIGQYTVRTRDGERYPVFGRTYDSSENGDERGIAVGYGCCGNQTRYGSGSRKTHEEARTVVQQKLIAARQKHIEEGLQVTEIEWAKGQSPAETLPVQAPPETAEAPATAPPRARARKKATKTATAEA